MIKADTNFKKLLITLISYFAASHPQNYSKQKEIIVLLEDKRK